MTEVLTRLATTLADKYRVEREIGVGGMATVYLAHDLKHDRDVAIKVLHPDLGAALGADRFLAEIRTTARLQHPHILPLLDSGEADGLLYYVMPYVTGETLRDRLTRERQLPIEDAVRIAREVADALGEAHTHGIVHRDIKPENILLRGGHALVADFGIALAVQTAGGQRMTQTGLSLGTPQYMSPEQAMGDRTIDARTDIYSLGAVTYEMLTGEPPFSGPTVQSIVAKVLTERPMLPTAVRDTVPAAVEAAVLRSLAKLAADRFTSAEKFAEALSRGEATTSAARTVAIQGSVASTPRSRSASLAMLAVGLLVGAGIAGAGATWWLTRGAGGADARWTEFSQLTDASGVETSPSLSPDGQYFAYASNAKGSFDVYVQRVGGRTPVLVAGDSTVDELAPAYSPDGTRIAYHRRSSGIFIVGATGESPRRLTTFGSDAAWSPDGQHIAFGSEEVKTAYDVNSTGELWVVDVAGGQPRRIGTKETFGVYQPAWSPSGARVAFWSVSNGQRDVETMRLDGSDRVKVTNDRDVDWAPAWSADGKYLYFASDRGGTMGLWRIAMDASSGHVGGVPEPVAAGVDVAMDLPRPSRDGSALIFRSKLETVNPAAIAFDPVAAHIGTVELLQHRTGTLVPYDVSPDGKWLALASVLDRRQDIFIMHPDGAGLTRLTDDAARDWGPRFIPDGSGVTFYSNLRGKYDAWSIRLDGSARTQLSNFPTGVVFPMFGPDGKRLMVSPLPRGTHIGQPPWPMTPATATEVRGLAVSGGELTLTYWSHGGRWISGYVLDSAGEISGYGVVDVVAGTGRRLNDDSHGYDLGWLPDQRHVVYFDAHDELVVQDVETLARRKVTGTLPYPPETFGSLVASADGRTLYYGARQMESNLWMVRRPAKEGAH